MWMPEEARPQRRSMFGGRGKNILGALAEGMATFSAGMGNPAGATVMQSMQARRQSLAQAAAEAAQYEKKREDSYNDWLRKQQWELENAPKTQNNDTVNDYNFIRERLGDDAANNYLRNMGDPMVTVQLPGNRVYSGPRSQMGTALGGGAPPPLASNPDTQPGEEDGYVYTPGPGGRANQGNWKPKGGQSVAPAAGFPRSF